MNCLHTHNENNRTVLSFHSISRYEYTCKPQSKRKEKEKPELVNYNTVWPAFHRHDDLLSIRNCARTRKKMTTTWSTKHSINMSVCVCVIWLSLNYSICIYGFQSTRLLLTHNSNSNNNNNNDDDDNDDNNNQGEIIVCKSDLKLIEISWRTNSCSTNFSQYWTQKIRKFGNWAPKMYLSFTQTQNMTLDLFFGLILLHMQNDISVIAGINTRWCVIHTIIFIVLST